MGGHVTIRWLRVVPGRIMLTDAEGRQYRTDWLDPGDPRRERLPDHTRQQLDALESDFKPAAWGRYSWRSLLTMLIVLLLASAVIVGVGTYAMFPRRAILVILGAVIGVLPLIVLGTYIGGNLWVRRTGAAARIGACLVGERCPACLEAIDSLTPRPVETVPCVCGAVWPTIGALQAGGRSIPVAAVVARTNDLAWIIPLGLLSVLMSLGTAIVPPMDQIVGTAACLFLLGIFAPFIVAARPARALRLGFAVGVPPLLMVVWILVRSGSINMPLLVGGTVAFGLCYAMGRVGTPKPDRPGWEVAQFVCASCGYDLRGASTSATPITRCPECGAATPDRPKP